MKKKNSLIGKFFHSIGDDKLIRWQGQIIAEPKTNVYLVRVFDFMIGQEACQYLIPIDEMKGWMFYNDNESLIYSYEHGSARHLRHEIHENKDDLLKEK